MFGHIEDVNIGQIFESREALAEAGIHTPSQAGIWGAAEGAYSIVLSGGYEDDVDELDYVLYTGQGGRDASTGHQVADQEFIRGNKGLKLSCEYNLPVRVTRGHQIGSGPESGYRYDGLYYVRKYERIRGSSGFLICRFHLASLLDREEIEKKLVGCFKKTFQSVDRKLSLVTRLKRDVKLSEKLKTMYDYTCQVCGVKLDSPSGSIANGAHIKALGYPHNGPDVIQNMLCLCPNHHEQFDAFSYYIDPQKLIIRNLDKLDGQKIYVHEKHEISTEFLAYQQHQFEKAN
ncbi:HNH endonuclease [Alphaproteobacteria bacterium]|nr:HNH endonuclease [Alphaproteobacteria bacterium]